MLYLKKFILLSVFFLKKVRYKKLLKFHLNKDVKKNINYFVKNAYKLPFKKKKKKKKKKFQKKQFKNLKKKKRRKKNFKKKKPRRKNYSRILFFRKRMLYWSTKYKRFRYIKYNPFVLCTFKRRGTIFLKKNKYNKKPLLKLRLFKDKKIKKKKKKKYKKISMSRKKKKKKKVTNSVVSELKKANKPFLYVTQRTLKSIFFWRTLYGILSDRKYDFVKDVFLKNFFLHGVIKSFLQKGRFAVIHYQFLKIFSFIFLSYRVSPFLFFFKLLFLLKTPMKLRSFVKSGRVRFFPATLPLYNQYTFCLLLFKKSVYKRQEMTIIYKILAELLDILFTNTGISIAALTYILAVAEDNKTAIRFSIYKQKKF
jgi:hypothetical protein